MRRVCVIRNGKQDYIMAKLRTGVKRYTNGRIVNAQRGETPEQARATVLAQPHRQGVVDPRAGYAHGRLRLGGSLTQRQYEAAEAFTRRAVSYMQIVTGSLPRFPSLSAEMVSQGIACAPDITDERIASIRSDYAELQDALADGGLHHGGNQVLVRVCLMDRDPTTEEELGDLRCALNLIAHRLRM
jgi:hypothetical protein